MKLTLLGTGAPESNPRRASSGYLVETGESRILLDCGGGVVSRLIESGRRPADVTHLVFSHLHSDHMMDYGRLVHAAWDEGAAPLPVWGPPPIVRITERLFGRDGALAHDLIARTENPGSQEVWVARGGSLPRPWPAPHISEVQPGFTIETNNWRLTSCSVPHAQPQLTCMALRLDAGGRSFVYSGDAALCPELETLAQGADCLLHWCYRASGEATHDYVRKMSPLPEEIGAMAARAQVSRLVLTHLRPQHDNDLVRQVMHNDAQRTFAGQVDIAEDLVEIIV